MKVLCITGTPGTGKTTLALKLSGKLGYPVLDVNKFIKEKKLEESYDNSRHTYVVDEKKLAKGIVKEISAVKKVYNPEGIIIDSHMSHFLPKRYVDICIVTQVSLKVLENRLKKRGYHKQKIRDNLEAEIFETCLTEAKESGHSVIVINTTKGIKITSVLHMIKGELT